ncbi:hypothetical protein Leryth_021977 [Lithospermum erythrorhizon]|nr:hypothetical protein Leryth_021977 [Lithospermum erythrorhizon]
MVGVETKTTMNMSSNMPNKSPKLSNKQEMLTPLAPYVHVPELLHPAADSTSSAYESYIMLPELKSLWEKQEFTDWKSQHILKPALQGLELTFRFISTALFDPRPYINKREMNRRLESLAATQIEIIATLLEDEIGDNQALTMGVGAKISENSLLPALCGWQRSERVARKIIHTIEREMINCPHTLGLGEPNMSNKPTLNYDLISKPLELHSLKQGSFETDSNFQSYENQTIFTIHQILETWIFVSKQVIRKLVSEINNKDYSKASTLCWLLEKMWKLLTEIEDTHLLMDPDDFLRLKNQLSIKVSTESDLFCFRSKGLIEITKLSKELRHKVPEILEAEVDPKGGPTIQTEAMKLYRKKDGFERIHLLQGMQAVEMAVKRFYYSYKQLVVVVMGSLEVNMNRGLQVMDAGHVLDRIFLDPTYYPSLDAAKTFLGYYYWKHEKGN